jgi:hypothetical protein
VLATFCWTKSLLCNVADFTGMPYQFRFFKYSKFISLIWKGPYYDKIGVTSIKKEFLDSKKTLQSLQLSKSLIPSLSSKQFSETPRHSSVSNINNDAFKQFSETPRLCKVYSTPRPTSRPPTRKQVKDSQRHNPRQTKTRKNRLKMVFVGPLVNPLCFCC